MLKNALRALEVCVVRNRRRFGARVPADPHEASPVPDVKGHAATIAAYSFKALGGPVKALPGGLRDV